MAGPGFKRLSPKLLAAATAWGCLVLAGCLPQPPREPLTALPNIQLPRDQSNPTLDLLRLDTRSGLLYVPHTSNDALDIIDMKTNKLVGTVPHLRNIKGVALTPEPSTIFTSNAGDGTVSVVDTSHLKVVQQITVGGGPDAIDYDPIHDVVVVSLKSGKAVALIDRVSYKVVSTIPLAGDPELMDVDRTTGVLFIAIHNLDEIQAIDLGSHQVTKTYKGCDISGPTGVAYDDQLGRLYVANHLVISVIDVVLDRCAGTVDISRGTDQIAINSHLHHLYTASGGSKNLSVIDTTSLKHLGFQGTGPSAVGVAVDPSTDRVYVAVGRPGIIAVFHDP